MAIEILDKGATRVMGTLAERGETIDDVILALGLIDVTLGLDTVYHYDKPVAVADFVAMFGQMVYPDGSGGRDRAMYPLDDAGFTVVADAPSFGYSFAVFKVRKSPVTVTPFVT